MQFMPRSSTLNLRKLPFIPVALQVYLPAICPVSILPGLLTTKNHLQVGLPCATGLGQAWF